MTSARRRHASGDFEISRRSVPALKCLPEAAITTADTFGSESARPIWPASSLMSAAPSTFTGGWLRVSTATRPCFSKVTLIRAPAPRQGEESGFRFGFLQESAEFAAPDRGKGVRPVTSRFIGDGNHDGTAVL